MASSIMHLAVINELARRFQFKDLNRLRFGAILPDAGTKDVSHLKISICGCNKTTYDLEGFRSRFGHLMRTDGLYLGYYLHLIQDTVYRHFVYDRYHWDPTIPGNVEKLHNDYVITNHFIAGKYGLQDDLIVPSRMDTEPICDLCHYDIQELMLSVKSAYQELQDEDVFFFSTEMADEYIDEAVKACLSELEALTAGGKLTDSYDNAWERPPYSLLETTLNTRELGGYRTGDGRYTRFHSLIRSDVANYPSKKDIVFLRKNGITTIIDTRTRIEAERKPHGLEGADGFHYINIPIDEGSGVPESIEAVPESYYKIAKSARIGEVFQTIAEAKTGALFGCTAGKDRTGVITALLLWLCGVSREDIIFDYMRTKRNNRPRFDLIHKNFPELDMNIIIPNENNMQVFMDRIREEYETIENYYIAVGVSKDLQQKIRRRMIL